MTTFGNAAQVITAIEIKPEDHAKFDQLCAELRALAAANLNPVWTFVQHGPVCVEVAGCALFKSSAVAIAAVKPSEIGVGAV